MSRHAGTLALAAGLALFGCAAGAWTGSGDHVPPGWRPPPESDEAGLWLQMDRLETGLRTSGLRLQNVELEAYLYRIVCRLIPDNCRDIRVYVMRNPFFNASMAPNGMMQIWTGVLLRVEDEAELAFVLGHEIAHYLRRHSVQTWRDVRRKSAFLSVTGVVLRGSLGNLGGAVQGGVALATVGSVYAFSRDNEREADEAGLRLMSQAGYDPSAAPAIWERLLEEQRASPRSSPALFVATHPSTTERMVRLRELAGTVTTRGVAERRRAEYLERTRASHLMLLGDELGRRDFAASEVVLRRLLAEGMSPGKAYFFQGELYRLRGLSEDEPLAVRAYRKALEFPDAPPQTQRNLGFLLVKSGDPAGARSALERYLELLPDAEDREMIKARLGHLEEVAR